MSLFFAYLALYVALTGGAFGPEVTLVITSAVVGVILREETTLRQRTAAHLTLETLRVEVFILHAQHFTRTFLLARLTQGLA